MNDPIAYTRARTANAGTLALLDEVERGRARRDKRGDSARMNYAYDLPPHIRGWDARHLRKIRERAWNAANLLNALLALGCPGSEAARLAQKSSYIGNPPARYGRH
jgi:hypothetical protein